MTVSPAELEITEASCPTEIHEFTIGKQIVNSGVTNLKIDKSVPLTYGGGKTSLATKLVSFGSSCAEYKKNAV